MDKTTLFDIEELNEALVTTTLDEVYGLIETIEKAAEIYMKICDKQIVQSISNENLIEIANAFKINYRKGIID